MPLPLLPPRAHPRAYAQGLYLPAPARRWTIDGFPGFTIDENGRLWRGAYTDAAGHRRAAKEMRTRTLLNTSHFRLCAGGRVVWISQRKMRALLRPA